MAGDTVRKRKFDRSLQLEYDRDRLIDMKMIQVYQLLVPEKTWIKKNRPKKGSQRHDDSRDICESILGSPKRRAHN